MARLQYGGSRQLNLRQLWWSVSRVFLLPDATRDRVWLVLRVYRKPAISLWLAEGGGPFAWKGHATLPHTLDHFVACLPPRAEEPWLLGCGHGQNGAWGPLAAGAWASQEVPFTFHYPEAAFDVGRERLVLLSKNWGPAAAALRELDVHGASPPLPPPFHDSNLLGTIGGYDAPTRRTVWANDGQAAAWDGRTWTPLPPPPPLTSSPRDGEGVTVGTQGAGGRFAILNKTSSRLTSLHLLDGDGWTTTDIETPGSDRRVLTAAYDPRRDGTLVLCETGQMLLVRGGNVERVHANSPGGMSRGSFGPRGLLWADGLAAYRVHDERATTEPEAEAAVRAIYVARPDHDLGVTRDGALIARTRGAVTPIAAPPPGFTAEINAVCWDDARGCLVVIDELGGTWESDGTAPLERKAIRGKRPAEWGALLAYEPSSRTCVLTGGNADILRPSGKTWHYDGKAWRAWTTRRVGERSASAFVLAADASTGGLVLVVGNPTRWFIHLYRGEGRFTPVAPIAPSPVGYPTFAFDPATRALVGYGQADDGSGGGTTLRVELGELLDRAAARPAEGGPEEVTAHVMKLVRSATAAAGAGADVFGGPGPLAEAPRCASCDAPMPHVLTLGTDPDRLPLREHAGLALYACDECDESSEPHAGSNAVVLLRSREAPTPLAGKPRRGTTQLTRRAVRYDVRQEAIWPSKPVRSIVAKVGGVTHWVQAESIPSCRTCECDMRFVVQLPASLDRRLNFGDQGVGYVFTCPHEHEAVFFWQCS